MQLLEIFSIILLCLVLLALVWLIAAMFGSGLTLASFMKLTHSVFLGVPMKRSGSKIREVGFGMVLPMAVLSLLCILFSSIHLTIHFLLLRMVPFSDIRHNQRIRIINTLKFNINHLISETTALNKKRAVYCTHQRIIPILNNHSLTS